MLPKVKKLKAELEALGVEIKDVEPWDEDCDAAINLGGKHEKVHVQVGVDYYCVVVEPEYGTFRFICGNGDLAHELDLALHPEKETPPKMKSVWE